MYVLAKYKNMSFNNNIFRYKHLLTIEIIQSTIILKNHH